MNRVSQKFRFLFCLFALVSTDVCFAGSTIKVMKAEGGVVVSSAGQPTERKVTSNSVLPPKTTLTTGPSGRAVVRVGEVGYVVLENNSKIAINNTKDHADIFRHLTGMIYYAINTIKGGQDPIKVNMQAATIGIRGTRFIVSDLPGRSEIGMRKGLVSVTSPSGEFEIHRQAELDEFEAYKREGQDAIDDEKRDFAEYKEDSQREFIEYKREFSLGANRMASFDGKRVEDRPLSEETRKNMETLEDYASQWLKEVRD